MSRKNTKISLIKIKKALLPQFINQEKAIEALYYSYTTQNNIILYGEGGYGKSQLIKEFFKLIKVQLNILQCDISTTTDKLLGPINLKKWKEESIYETNFEGSLFVQPGVLVLEEFMDVPPAIASALKDVLQEGGYRRGPDFIPSNITSVIITGNKSPKSVALTDSLKALYLDRFIYHVNVTWPTHTIENYIDLFQFHFKEDDMTEEIDLLAEICSEFTITPRMALEAYRLHKVGGFKRVQAMHVLKNTDLTKILNSLYE